MLAKISNDGTSEYMMHIKIYFIGDLYFQMTPAISTFKYQKYYDFYPVPKDFSSYSKL